MFHFIFKQTGVTEMERFCFCVALNLISLNYFFFKFVMSE